MNAGYKPRVPRQFVGGYRPRIDAAEKARGCAPYADDEICDRNYPGLLHARVLRCPYPRARIKHLDTTKAAKVAPYAFLVFETSPGNFQAWVSLAGQALPDDLARRLKHGAGADLSASGATRIAGSLNFKPKYAPAFPRVTITQTAAGRVTTPEALESAGLLAAPLPPPRVSPANLRQYRGPRKWPDYARNLAAAPRNAEGEPDRSNADFVWCMTAIDWGWSVEDTAARLAELSAKAEQWEHYAMLTATKAAAAVARNRGQGTVKAPEHRLH